MRCQSIHHYYHVYADADWLTPSTDHAAALKYGLPMDSFNIGVVGNRKNRKLAIEWWAQYGATVVNESDSGWEQVTLKPLYDFSLKNPGQFVVYGHTKGATTRTELSATWRRTMEYFNIVKWDVPLELMLSGMDTVGIMWYDQMSHPPYPTVNTLAYWAGTYWWANTSYIQLLGECEYDHRYRAELWIGKLARHESIRRHDMFPYVPTALGPEWDWDDT